MKFVRSQRKKRKSAVKKSEWRAQLTASDSADIGKVHLLEFRQLRVIRTRDTSHISRTFRRLSASINGISDFEALGDFWALDDVSVSSFFA